MESEDCRQGPTNPNRQSGVRTVGHGVAHKNGAEAGLLQRPDYVMGCLRLAAAGPYSRHRNHLRTHLPT